MAIEEVLEDKEASVIRIWLEGNGVYAGCENGSIENASKVLDLEKDGIVNSKDFPFTNELTPGNYKIDKIIYGENNKDGDWGNLSFEEYVSLGKPRKVRMSTKKTITVL